MIRKWIVALSTLIMALLQACGQQQATEYGKNPLILDDFTFDLDIPQFFRDERIFRYTHDEFSVGSEEYRLDDDSLMTGFISYRTASWSPSRTLASYAGVKFENLGLVVDWDDEHPLLAYAATDYGRWDDLRKVIDALKEEYEPSPILERGGFMQDNTLYLVFKADDKCAKVLFNLSDIDAIVPEESDDERVPLRLTPETEVAIERQLTEDSQRANQHELSFQLFVYTPEIGVVLEHLGYSSAFLTKFE